MWTREELKTRAKAVLKVHYWKLFLVSFIMSIIGADQGGGGGGGSNSSSFQRFSSPGEIAFIIGMVLMILLVAIGVRVFIGYAIDVGGKRFYIDAAGYEVNINSLGYAFKKGKYIKIIVTQLRKDVQLFLWSLLFLIPGIIKTYSYLMVPYILADNPAIGSARAIELSRGMMDGHKGETFVLYLSFIGWYLLGLLALFIGVLFVTPYVRATEAELYIRLKELAIEKGIAHSSEYEYMPLEGM